MILEEEGIFPVIITVHRKEKNVCTGIELMYTMAVQMNTREGELVL